MEDGLVARTLDEKPPRMSASAAPRWLLKTNTRDTLNLATANGEAAGVPVTALPENEDPLQGLPFHRLFPLVESNRLAALFTLPPKEERAEDWYVCTITRQGLVKKTPLDELPGPTARPFTLAKFNEGDSLGWVHLTDGKAELLLVSAQGMAIRFSEDEVRPMGLVAAGVGGIKLAKGDELIGGELIPGRGEVLVIASDGKAKRLDVSQFPVQGRYGQGVIVWKLAKGARLVGLAAGKGGLRVTLHLLKLMSDFSRTTRTHRGAMSKGILRFEPGNDGAVLHKGQDPVWTCFYTFGVAIAQVALHGLPGAGIVLNAAVRAHQRAQAAPQALILVYPDDAVVRVFVNRSGRAAFFTGRFTALTADHGNVKRLVFQVYHFHAAAAPILTSVETPLPADRASRGALVFSDSYRIMERLHFHISL